MENPQAGASVPPLTPEQVFRDYAPRVYSLARRMLNSEDAALDHETRELIERAIAELPEVYRDVFVLADVEGLPNAEIGEILGLSVAAVKSRLHRARLVMRDALAPHFEEVPA